RFDVPSFRPIWPVALLKSIVTCGGDDGASLAESRRSRGGLGMEVSDMLLSQSVPYRPAGRQVNVPLCAYRGSPADPPGPGAVTGAGLTENPSRALSRHRSASATALKAR